MTTSIQLNSGFSIPQIGVGTSKSVSPAESVRTALHAGYGHVDTAQMYDNETEVGEGVRSADVPREDVFVTTKLNNDFHSPAEVHRTFGESLDRLGLEYVDLFLIHWPMPFLDVDYVDTWKVMIELKDSGRAKSIGVSNFQAEHLDRIVESTGVIPSVNQIEVHPYFANEEVRAHSASLGTVVEAWSPLGKGDEFSEPVITEIAARHERSPAQVILRWHLQRGDVAIPKSDHEPRLRENLAVFDFELSGEDVAAISALDKGEAGRRSPHPSEFGK